MNRFHFHWVWWPWYSSVPYLWRPIGGMSQVYRWILYCGPLFVGRWTERLRR